METENSSVGEMTEVDDINHEQLLGDFPDSEWAKEFAAGREAADSVADPAAEQEPEPAAEQEQEPAAEQVAKSDSGISNASEAIASALEKLNEKLDKQGKTVQPETEEVTAAEVQADIFQSLNIELPDLSSEEVQDILKSDDLSPEVRGLFQKLHEGYTKAISEIGHQVKSSQADAQAAQAALANQKFWSEVKGHEEAFTDYIKPAGNLGSEAELGDVAKAWLEEQPVFIAEAAKKTLLEGNSSEVASVIAAIKSSKADKTETPPKPNSKESGSDQSTEDIVKEKIENAKELLSQPNSMNNLPGEQVPPSNKDKLNNAEDLTSAARSIHKGNLEKFDELLDDLLE